MQNDKIKCVSLPTPDQYQINGVVLSTCFTLLTTKRVQSTNINLHRILTPAQSTRWCLIFDAQVIAEASTQVEIETISRVTYNQYKTTVYNPIDRVATYTWLN